MNYRVLVIFFASLLLSTTSCNRKSSDLILACGWDEVFMADISKEVPEKVWSWKASESELLPPFMKNKFLTTDECKPFKNGTEILITSSGGGVALIEQATGKTLFYASVPNAHSAEILPENLIVTAASYSSEGNRLSLYDQDKSDIVLSSDSLYGAHAVVWDDHREILWALGTEELRTYRLEGDADKSMLIQLKSFTLPDIGGHDLVFLSHNKSICLSTDNNVWYFDIENESFSKHPELGEEARVKSISYSRLNKKTAYVKATEENWWAYYIRFADSNKVVHLPGEKIYKVRWVYK